VKLLVSPIGVAINRPHVAEIVAQQLQTQGSMRICS
jgi:hypothetical protein